MDLIAKPSSDPFIGLSSAISGEREISLARDPLISRIPPEMLAYIFALAQLSKNESISPSKPPLLFCQVCSSWRQIALTSPQLWSHIQFSTHNDAHDSFKNASRAARYISLSKIFVQRSGVVPLSLYISLCFIDAPNVTMQLVLPQRHRITHLNLTLPLVQLESLFKLPSRMLPSLVSLTIICMPHILFADDIGSPLSLSAPAAFRECEMLKYVSLGIHDNFCIGPTTRRRNALRNSRMETDSSRLRLPWNGLQELHLNHISMLITEVHDILQETEIIQSLSISILLGADFRGRQMIVLPRIRFFHIDIASQGSIDSFFNALTLPSLETLEITSLKRFGAFPASDFQVQALLTLQERSQFRLRSFQASHITLSDFDLMVSFLKKCSALRSLGLTFTGLERPKLIEMLTLHHRSPSSSSPKKSKKNILPNLSKLKVIGPDWNSYPPWTKVCQSVVKMVQSRVSTATTSVSPSHFLKKLTFGSTALFPTGTCCTALHECTRLGLLVELLQVSQTSSNIEGKYSPNEDGTLWPVPIAM